MRIVVLVSANAEWRSVKALFPKAALESSPFGEWFNASVDGQALIFFQGGWGKITAAATAQYAIDRFEPELIINPGTCGGFEGRIETGTVILAEKTVVYDIIEQMTDPEAAIDFYSTNLDLSWLKEPLPSVVRRALLVSADRDIVTRDIPGLVSRYGACAADWESGAIAWVAKRNGVRCLILRGVSDLVNADGGEVYGNYGVFEQRTDDIMRRLVGELGEWVKAASVT